MEVLVSKTPHPDRSFIVQRVVNGEFQILKETTTDSGEIISGTNELLTIQTIVITRRIGEKTTF